MHISTCALICTCTLHPVDFIEGCSPEFLSHFIAQVARGDPARSRRPPNPSLHALSEGVEAVVECEGVSCIARRAATRSAEGPFPAEDDAVLRPTSPREGPRALGLRRPSDGTARGRRNAPRRPRGWHRLRPVDELLLLCCSRSSAAPSRQGTPEGEVPCGEEARARRLGHVTHSSHSLGFSERFLKGFSEGFLEGFSEGFSQGFSEGFRFKGRDCAHPRVRATL